MMQDFSWLSRTQLMVGDEGIKKLANSHVMVVGLGGVGSYAAEFIARSGVGTMTIVDGDIVDPSNRNRQLPALTSTQGKSKAILMAERIKDINPEIQLQTIQDFVRPEMVENLIRLQPDYIIDAIDSFTPKLTLISEAMKANIPLVSSMGAGGRMDPMQLKIDDISKTYNCPFAYQIRKRLRKQYNIHKGFTTIYSSELPDRDSIMLTDGSNFKKSAFGTMSFIPALFGTYACSVVIRRILGKKV